MKKIILSLFALVTTLLPLSAQETDLRPSLDIFLHHLENELKSEASPSLVAYFSNCVSSNLNGEEIHYDPEALLQSKGFNKADFMMSLQGFQLAAERDDGSVCFENNLNPLLSESSFLLVKTSALNLRKGPSTSSTVLARLNEGVFEGRIDANLPKLRNENTGFIWVPVRVNVPGMGWVSAYTAQTFIQELGPSAGLRISLAYTDLGWKIIEVVRPELTSENALSSIP